MGRRNRTIDDDHEQTDAAQNHPGGSLGIVALCGGVVLAGAGSTAITDGGGDDLARLGGIGGGRGRWKSGRQAC